MAIDLSSVVNSIIESTNVYRRTRASRSRNKKILTYDTETDPFHNCEDLECEKCFGGGRVPEPFLHGFYDGESDEYWEFETIDDVVKFATPRRILVYAHNGGKFDYHPLRPYMNTDEPIRLINGRIAEFRIGEATFRDSLNIFPNTRLADFGVKHEIDYEKMEPGTRDIPEIRKEISLYMRQDCKGLWEQVMRFKSQYGTRNGIQLTQAGTMMKRWERNCYKQKAPRQTRQNFKDCSPFYYGGRVQCFESGVRDTKFKVSDMNSAYPKAMLENHPISPAPSESFHLPRTDEAIKTCLIQLRCTARGCFPWRDDKRELYFPEDEAGNRARMRRYFITGWEFLTALELDAVANIQIERVLTFAQTINFSDYILPAYEARKKAKRDGDKAEVIFRKFEMNGVYGKFGADPSNYADYVIATPDSIGRWKGCGYEEYQDWGEDKWLYARPPSEEDLNDIQSKWRYYNVATAASITGYVRANLFKAIARSSGVIYCDTDSLVARSANLDYGNELGQWKDEGDFDRYAIAGKKLYAFHSSGAPLEYDPAEKRWGPDKKDPSWKIASKGVNFASYASGLKDKKGRVLPSGPEMITDLALGGTVTHLPQVPTYSVTREKPMFVKRSIKSTAKDIRIAPESVIDSFRQIAPHLYLA